MGERENTKKAAAWSSQRPRQAGGYNNNVLKEAEALQKLLREQGKEPVLYVIGRKGVNYYRFRKRQVTASWTGFSEQPAYAHAAEVARVLVASFMAGAGEQGEEAVETDRYRPEVVSPSRAAPRPPAVVKGHSPGGEPDGPAGGVHRKTRHRRGRARRRGARPVPVRVSRLYEFEQNADTLSDGADEVTAPAVAARMESPGGVGEPAARE